jgi:hypothetical protein
MTWLTVYDIESVPFCIVLKRQCIGYPNGNRLHSLSSKLLNLFLWAWCLEACLEFQELFLLLHQRLSLVPKLKFVNDLFVLDFLDFESFMYLYKDNLVVTYTVKTSCEWNCTSSGFSYDFSDLTINQSPQGLLCDIFEKFSSLLLSFFLLLCSLVHIFFVDFNEFFLPISGYLEWWVWGLLDTHESYLFYVFLS